MADGKIQRSSARQDACGRAKSSNRYATPLTSYRCQQYALRAQELASLNNHLIRMWTSSGCGLPATNEGYIFPYGRCGIEATTPIHRTRQARHNQTAPRHVDDEPSLDIVFIGSSRNTRLRVRGSEKIGSAGKEG